MELNEAGAKIARDAREVAGRDVLIAGSIGPLGTSLEYVGNDTSSGAALYGEQAAVLAGRGVDLIVLETFTSLEELVVAVGAVRAQCDLPVIAQITVQDDGETVTGARGDEVAGRAGRPGRGRCRHQLQPGAAVGAGRPARDAAGGDHAADRPAEHRPAHVPRRPRALSGRVARPTSASSPPRRWQLGARLIGGCCGSQPHHIAAIRRAVDEQRPRPLRLHAGASRAAHPAPPAPAAETALAQRLAAGEWVVSVELDPPKGANLRAAVRAGRHEIARTPAASSSSTSTTTRWRARG